MIASLFGIFGPLILSSIEAWLVRSAANAQAMQAFYSFAQQMQNMGIKWASGAQQLASQDPSKDPQPPAS